MRNAVWRGLATTTAALLVLVTAGSSIADSRSGTINGWLGTSSYKTVSTGEGETDGTYFDSEFSSLAELVEAQTELAEQIAAEGSVLLKNDNEALPLDVDTETVTLWGLNSANPMLGGNLGSSAVVNSDAGQESYDLEEAMILEGFTLNQTMIDFYEDESLDEYRMSVNFFGNEVSGHALATSFTATYEETTEYNIGEAPPEVYTDEVLASADGTAAVVVLTRDSTEASDYNLSMEATNGDSYERPLALSEWERAMIELAKEHSTKVIVLINSTNPMEIEELKNDDGIDSILWVGLPGISGFLGVADVLSGEANPSGHLTDTYAVNVTSAPSMVNSGIYTYENNSTVSDDLSGDDYGDWYLVESEGIYVGYKYYETRYEDYILGRGNADAAEGSTSGDGWLYENEVSYSFGYGLSYTTFAQEIVDLEVNIGGTGTITVTVTNTGDVAGKDVVQLYVQAPYTEGGIEKSAVQLLAYGKTDLLEPGESQTLTIEFDPQYMASYDETAVKADGTVGAWVLEAGDYYFAIGNGAHEALNNILANKLGSTEGLVSTSENDSIESEDAVVWTLDETDIETYSENVENSLQDADLNNLIEDAVEYTTRSDWTKGWTAVTGITATEEMLVYLTNSANELTENGDGVTWGADNGLTIADFILTDENGDYVGVVDIEDESWDLLVEELTLEEAINFIENNGEGLQSIESIGYPANASQDGPIGVAYDQVAGYAVKWSESEADEPTYVSSDDEYAYYSMAVMPTEPVVAATFNQELVEREGEIFGEISLWSNIPSFMSPGLNLHRNPYCGRNHEYYSEDSMLTNLTGTALTKGASSKGLMMQVKHFAFNHQEINRTGLSTFVSEQAARENELRGFQGALESNNAMSIMTSFNRVGTAYSASCEGLLVHILREEWGFTGWITTDLINGAEYQNWLDTISGGASAVLSNRTSFAETSLGTMNDNLDAIMSDTEFQEKMQQGIKYALYTSARSNALNGITSDTQIVEIMTWWQIALMAVRIVLAALTVLFALLHILGIRKRTGTSSAVSE